MRELRHLLRRVAPYRVPLLLQGEEGTGKRHVARIIHTLSAHRNGPFVVVDCGVLPEMMLAVELFGCEPGICSFSSSMPGKIEFAREGTLVLTHAEAMPTWVLMRLTQALDRLSVERLGAGDARPVQVRLIVAITDPWPSAPDDPGETARVLRRLLDGFAVTVPPLRERDRDVLVLASYFLDCANRELDKRVRGFSRAAMAELLTYPWPGNVGELKRSVRFSACAASELVRPEHLPPHIRAGCGVLPRRRETADRERRGRIR